MNWASRGSNIVGIAQQRRHAHDWMPAISGRLGHVTVRHLDLGLLVLPWLVLLVVTAAGIILSMDAAVALRPPASAIAVTGLNRDAVGIDAEAVVADPDLVG